MTVRCHYCMKEAKLVSGKDIYPHRKDLAKLKFWQCKPCDAYVGTHKNSNRHAPLGRLANAELRAAKSEAHRAFDPIWKKGKKNRKQAYAWLAGKLGVSPSNCHIGMFDIHLCKHVVQVSREYRGIPA